MKLATMALVGLMMCVPSSAQHYSTDGHYSVDGKVITFSGNPDFQSYVIMTESSLGEHECKELNGNVRHGRCVFIVNFELTRTIHCSVNRYPKPAGNPHGLFLTHVECSTPMYRTKKGHK